MTPLIFTTLYLIYLSLICQSLIMYDSVGYEISGQELVQNGLAGYFKTGPHREPIYPLLIAGAMQLAKTFSLEYRWVLKLLHIFILVLTQALAFVMLRGLNVDRWIRTAAIVYMGVSPVLVNSAFWVYSEIAVLPQILLIILLAARSWNDIATSAKWSTHLWNGIGLGAALFLALCVKGIFEALTPLLLIPFVILIKSPRYRRAALTVVMTCAACFYIPLNAYKWANHVGNGNFAFTNRAAWALYGNTARRALPLGPGKIKAAFAYAANPHYCYNVSDKANCDFWSYIPSDQLGMGRLQELSQQGLSNQKINHMMMSESLQLAWKNPLQQIFLAEVESLKMFFWETTNAGQVTYPDWLEKLYKLPWLEPFLVVTTAFLSMGALGHLIVVGWRRRKELFDPGQSYSQALVLFMTVMLLAYGFAHSFFFVLQRYSIPIAPVWVIAIAFWSNHLWGRKRIQSG